MPRAVASCGQNTNTRPDNNVFRNACKRRTHRAHPGRAEGPRTLKQETGKPLSQSELARCLRVDGYPVPQPHISRMQEAIQYLLPAISTMLYAGLGRHQVEHLTSLRRATERI